MNMQDIQADIEQRMADRGVAKYRRMVEEAQQSGDATRIKSVQALMDTALGPVIEAVDDFRAEAKTGRAGRRHTAIAALEGISSGTVAFVGLSAMMDSMAMVKDATPTAILIGTSLETEAQMVEVEKTHSAYVKRLMDDLDGRTRNVSHRRAVLSKVIRERGEELERWTRQKQLTVGLKIMEMIVQTTGMFELSIRMSGTKRVMAIYATERLGSFLAQLDTRFGLMSPEYLPCVIPPKPWTGLREGGYHTDALAYPPRFVKTSCKQQEVELRKADLSLVYRAVNAIQDTAWQINDEVLEVAKALAERGSAVAGLPAMENEPLPARPLDIDTNEEARTAWKREASRTYDQNRKATGRRINSLRSLHVAEEFREFARIYFPHQLDFRGRVYPLPRGLNPQGNDLAKGLLRFAEGAPLDTVEAIHWFKVHGANSFGVDKESMDDRMAWVDENAEHIIRSAEDPLGYQWWADADSPFCFLAWAFEFNEWLARGAGTCGGAFVSRIPVAMDGSCNGLQHYSAMLRDPRGGAATNLTPSDKPQDIYGEVAKVVMRNLDTTSKTPYEADNEEAAAKARWAAGWRDFGIDRGITKRPVMVLPYGGTQLSCLDYVGEAVFERGATPFNDTEVRKAVSYLGTAVWGSIGEVVVSARLAMGWLKKAAGVVSKEGKALKWAAPSGFVVVQAYPKMEVSQIECFLLGNRFRPQLRLEEAGSIDPRRQQNGVAPNFVHSLDAAALILTVNKALDHGVTNFAMIHDSYGTTAKHSAKLAAALRESFVDMYEQNDVLEQFKETAIPAHLHDEVPTAPFVGGLDLNEVKKSLYFFA